MRKAYEYEILVDGKVVWSGQDPGNKFDEIRKKYPKKKVGIAWKPGKGVSYPDILTPIENLHSMERITS